MDGPYESLCEEADKGYGGCWGPKDSFSGRCVWMAPKEQLP